LAAYGEHSSIGQEDEGRIGAEDSHGPRLHEGWVRGIEDERLAVPSDQDSAAIQETDGWSAQIVASRQLDLREVADGPNRYLGVHPTEGATRLHFIRPA